MARAFWRLTAGLVLCLMASFPLRASATGAPMTGRDLYYLLVAQFASELHAPGLAIPAWKKVLSLMPQPRLLAAATRAAAHLGDLPEALAWAKHWHHEDPGNPNAARYEAALLLASGQDRKTIRFLQAALARFPQNARITEQLAELLGTHGHPGDARRLLTGFILHHPEDATAHFALGRLDMLQGQTDAATPEFRRALALRPSWQEAAIYLAESLRLQGQTLAALIQIGKFSSSHPGAILARQYQAGLYLHLGGMVQAYRIYRKLGEQLPDNPGIQLTLGVLALKQGNPRVAQRALGKTRALLPQSIASRYYLGRLAEKEHHWQQALGWFGQIPKGPYAVRAGLHALACKFHLGQQKMVLRHLAGRVPGHPEDARLLLLQARLLQEAGKPHAALKVLDAGLQQHPRDGEIWYEKGVAEERLGDQKAMKISMQEAIRLEPGNAQPYNFLGYSLLKHHEQMEEAAEYLRKALHLAPYDPGILDSVGWLYHLQGRQNRALKYLGKAHAALGNSPGIAHHLGQVFWALGRHQKARDLWQQALRAHPDSSILLRDLQQK